MELEEVLRNKNIDGEVYLSDIRRWIGDKVWTGLSHYERNKLQNDLTKIAND